MLLGFLEVSTYSTLTFVIRFTTTKLSFMRLFRCQAFYRLPFLFSINLLSSSIFTLNSATKMSQRPYGGKDLASGGGRVQLVH
jgi:hypothetical protein